MTKALVELLDSPTLPEASDTIRKRLEEERSLRQRFYDEIPDDKKGEFINGEIIMSSPAKQRHLRVRHNAENLIGNFVKLRLLGCQVCGEKALCVFPRNDYEPDLCFFGPEKSAGIDPETMKFPVPDFVIEILSESTEKRDRGVKFIDYAAHGVREYWIVDPVSEVLEQYLLPEEGEVYELHRKIATGEAISPVIAGLRIPVRALFDEAENLAALRAILAGAG